MSIRFMTRAAHFFSANSHKSWAAYGSRGGGRLNDGIAIYCVCLRKNCAFRCLLTPLRTCPEDLVLKAHKSSVHIFQRALSDLPVVFLKSPPDLS